MSNALPSPAGGPRPRSVPQEHRDDPIPQPPIGIGPALRRHRAAVGLSLRQLAGELGVSASFLSQLENGKSQPSVATLFALCGVLDVRVDDLFAESVATSDPREPTEGHVVRETGATVRPSRDRHAVPAGFSLPANADGPVLHAEGRRRLVLETGATWEQLVSSRTAPVEFVLITYEVGGGSTADGEMSRTCGTNYGYVISGRLTLSLGFDTFVLSPTDSVSFDSGIPHRCDNRGTEPAQVLWFTLSDAGAEVEHPLNRSGVSRGDEPAARTMESTQSGDRRTATSVRSNPASTSRRMAGATSGMTSHPG